MNFLQPQFLWAFAGLLVPFAIHLLSRKEGRVIRIGSIRHIRETPTRQFRSVRLNEYWLLFLRCLLLGGLVLFMSGWYMTGMKENHRWVLLEPGLEGRPGLKSVIDSLSNAGYERRFLIRGFPENLSKAEAAEIPDYFSLLDDLHNREIESVVIAMNRSAGFSGPRMALPENVKWIEVAPEAHEEVIRQVQLRRDSMWERRGSFSGASSSFSSYRKAGVGSEAKRPDTVHVVVAYNQEFETDNEIVLASLQAIKRQVPEVIKVQSVLAGSYSNTSPTWLIWLSSSEPPMGAKFTVLFEEKPLAGIIEPAGKGSYLLTSRLNSEIAVNRNFALHLMMTLFPDEEAMALAQRYDRRVVSTQAAFGGPSTLRPFDKLRAGSSGQAGSRTVGQEADQSFMRYLAIALLVLVALERQVAYQRVQ